MKEGSTLDYGEVKKARAYFAAAAHVWASEINLLPGHYISKSIDLAADFADWLDSKYDGMGRKFESVFDDATWTRTFQAEFPEIKRRRPARQGKLRKSAYALFGTNRVVTPQKSTSKVDFFECCPECGVVRRVKRRDPARPIEEIRAELEAVEKLQPGEYPSEWDVKKGKKQILVPWRPRIQEWLPSIDELKAKIDADPELREVIGSDLTDSFSRLKTAKKREYDAFYLSRPWWGKRDHIKKR